MSTIKLNHTKFHSKFSILILAFFILAGQLFGAVTGKIAGRVTDIGTGEPLIGANVIIEGTSMGAATDFEGYYVILNISPGTHTVRAMN